MHWDRKSICVVFIVLSLGFACISNTRSEMVGFQNLYGATPKGVIRFIASNNTSVSTFPRLLSKEESSKVLSSLVNHSSVSVINHTSIHLLLTINGSSLDSIINIQPNVNYTPNETELAITKNITTPIYDLHIQATGNIAAPDKSRKLEQITTYFVPYSVLQPEVVRKLKSGSIFENSTGILPTTFKFPLQGFHAVTYNDPEGVKVAIKIGEKGSGWIPVLGIFTTLIDTGLAAYDYHNTFQKLESRPDINKDRLQNEELIAYGSIVARLMIALVPILLPEAQVGVKTLVGATFGGFLIGKVIERYVNYRIDQLANPHGSVGKLQDCSLIDPLMTEEILNCLENNRDRIMDCLPYGPCPTAEYNYHEHRIKL